MRKEPVLIALVARGADPAFASLTTTLAESLADREDHGEVVIDLRIGRTPDEVHAALTTPADILGIFGHTGWTDDGQWVELLSVDLAQLPHGLDASVLLLHTCHLAGPGERHQLQALMAHPTPAFVCSAKAHHDVARCVGLPGLMIRAMLAPADASESWDDRLTHAWDTVEPELDKLLGPKDWKRWSVLRSHATP